MNNCKSSIDEKELSKRLKTLMENPDLLEDEPLAETNEKLSNNKITSPTLKDIRKLEISLVPDNPMRWLSVNIKTRKGSVIKDDRFSCFAYTADYAPICNSPLSSIFSRENSSDVLIEMISFRLLLPGQYILLLRDTKHASLGRIDFEIDNNSNILQQPMVMCNICSTEDVLATSLEHIDQDWNLLSRTPGTFALRRYAIECRQLNTYNKIIEGLKGRELTVSRNLLLCTINKDWDTQILQAFQKMILSEYHFLSVDCNTLYNAALQNPYETLTEKLGFPNRAVFCLTNPGAMLATGGKVVARQIVEKICEDPEKFKLWLCGSKSEIEGVLDVFPSLKDLFLRGNMLNQLPYSGSELVCAFLKALDDEHMDPSNAAREVIVKTILQHYEQGCLSTWSLNSIRRFVAEEVSPRYLHRTMGMMMTESTGLPRLEKEDVPLDRLPNSTSDFEDSIRELNEMVGLDDIKKSITTMANQSRFFIERQKAGFHTSSVATQHSIFTGNPGTGKTTVARMLGKIYHSIGLLSKGEVICADRTRLVGRYIGETEENMKAVLEEARGNVLFIDEAYNLYDGTADRKDFGSKVIDSLLTVLTQPNPDMVIIFAGYEKEMDAMLNSNPGLMGRFPNKYRFSDYDAEQLMAIALHLLAKDDYIIGNEAQQVLHQKISDTLAQRTKNFGNARWVEQFIRNGIIPAMANRVTHDAIKDYQVILPSDVEEGYQKFNPRMIELKPRRQVGFNA